MRLAALLAVALGSCYVPKPPPQNPPPADCNRACAHIVHELACGLSDADCSLLCSRTSANNPGVVDCWAAVDSCDQANACDVSTDAVKARK